MEHKNCMADQYILAMYDIRGKQEFIFKTNHLQEIIGASAIIRDCYTDYLYPAAAKYGKGIFHAKEPFSRETFASHIEEGYIGELIYDGGGNFLLLFKDADTYRDITYDFTKAILEKVGTLRVLGSFVGNLDFDHFENDRRRLYQQHRKDEATQAGAVPWGTLPMVQVDTLTSQPLVRRMRRNGENIKVTRESYAKYKKYDTEVTKMDKEQRYLDKLVLEKGVDSHIAIIYIDGNAMGAKVQQCCNGLKSYEDCIRALRDFSEEIQQDYIDERIKDIDRVLAEKHPGKEKNKRIVLGAGDEINLICNAYDALDVVKAYLNGLQQVKNEKGELKGCSSCAGIAIFRSHTPYADAYKIAEECCESGKKKMKAMGLSNACFVDFHYIQGAIGTSIDSIREREETIDCSRPWLLDQDNLQEKSLDCTCFSTVEKLHQLLNQLGRSNVKSLAEYAKKGALDLKLELTRMIAHMDEKVRNDAILKMMEQMGEEKFRKLLYDVVIVYDLWFGGKQ